MIKRRLVEEKVVVRNSIDFKKEKIALIYIFVDF